MKVLLDNWRQYLNEESNNVGKIIFYGDNIAIIGVSHEDALDRNLPKNVIKKLANIAKEGFYCEGRCEDVPKLKNLMRQNKIKLGPNRGQFDKAEELKVDRINWAYTLFTGGRFESEKWPKMILQGENDGSISTEALEAFKTKENKTAADVIKLMLTSTEFGPEGLNGYSDNEAEQVLQILRKSGVKIDVPAENTVSVMKDAAEKLFPGAGDVEGNNPLGQLSKNAQGKRRASLMQKLKKTGGIGLIGYSHLVHLVNKYGGEII
jgi:hypothetical protein